MSLAIGPWSECRNHAADVTAPPRSRSGAAKNSAKERLQSKQLGASFSKRTPASCFLENGAPQLTFWSSQTHSEVGLAALFPADWRTSWAHDAG